MSKIRDRGKMKWHSAFFMPEHVKMLKELRSDYQKINKPILDESQIDEFEQKLCMAFEYSKTVKIMVWDAGFFMHYKGVVKKLDGMLKKIYLEMEDGTYNLISFYNLIGIELEEDE